MRKFSAATLIELVITIVVIVFLVKTFVFFLKRTNQNETTAMALKEVYEILNSSMEKSKASGNSFFKLDWNNINTYEASENILNNKIIPFAKERDSCDKRYKCVSGYITLDREEHVGYNIGTDYAGAIVGKQKAFVALRTTGSCNFKRPNDLCGLLVIDIDNKSGYNQLGRDVFLFGFYGSGKLLPYGHNFSKDDIDKSCNSNASGETCGARIISDNWQIKYLDKIDEQ